MLHAVADRDLDEILATVSRSFYLSLAILPESLRTQLSVAYLVARAADTVADTAHIAPAQRVALLGQLRAAIADPGAIPGCVRAVAEGLVAPARSGDEKSDKERLLLTRLDDCLLRLAALAPADRERTREVLETLLAGMERDLERFADPTVLVALESLGDLDDYIYMAAGCVGEYWTHMTAAHVPALHRLGRPDFVARGVRLGKALQLVNVLRDAAADLSAGRCYLPRQLLNRHRLTPEALVDPRQRRDARPLFSELCALALAHVDAAFPYAMAIPRRQGRLRLAALWPLWIGLATLAKLTRAEDPLDPAQPVKVTRAEVYRIVAESTLALGSDRATVGLHARRRAQVRG